MQPTANMLAAGMDKPRYVVGVHGNYPRTDKAGQSTVSIPESTMAIALQNNGMIDSMDLDQAKQYLATNRSWRQNLIGGSISGIDFQKKGDKYTLTARAKDVQDGNASIGDIREVKNNMFIVDYDSLVFMANIEMLKIDRIAEKTVEASKAIGGSFASMFAPAAPSSDSIEDNTEDAEHEDITGLKPWGLTLESMVAYADESGLRDQLDGKQLTKAGALIKGKSLESLDATLDIIAG